MAAYLDLNPIRAGIAARAEDCRWCSYAAAVGGLRLARSGLAEVVTAARGSSRRLSWSKAQESYRQLLFGVGQEVHGGATPDGYVKSEGGFSQREIEEVCAAGGKLSIAEVLRCRVRLLKDCEQWLGGSSTQSLPGGRVLGNVAAGRKTNEIPAARRLFATMTSPKS